jgi:hypothetical protein
MKNKSQTALIIRMNACKKSGCSAPEPYLPILIKEAKIFGIKKAA